MSPVHLILLTPSEGASDVVDLKEGNVKVVEGMGKLRHVVCTDCGVCIYQYPDEAGIRTANTSGTLFNLLLKAVYFG